MQLDFDFSTGRLKSMADAVRVVINNYKSGYMYHGNQLHDDVAILYPPARKMYTDTIQRAMRRFCKHQYKTVNHNKSLYERV